MFAEEISIITTQAYHLSLQYVKEHINAAKHQYHMFMEQHFYILQSGIYLADNRSSELWINSLSHFPWSQNVSSITKKKMIDDFRQKKINF